jgi:uncharacterized membrane protein
LDILTLLVIVAVVVMALAVHQHRSHGSTAGGDTLDRIAQAILERERVGFRARAAREEIRSAIRRGMRDMR